MSFLKQLLRPFVEFDEDKPKEASQQLPVSPQPKEKPSAPASPSDAPAYHPLLADESKVVNDTQTPTYSPSGTLAGPLPEHEAYFERLIEDANLKNPFFQGNDFKEFVDSK